MSAEPHGEITVTLDPAEWHFLITTLNCTGAMLWALVTLREAMPDSFQVPITSDAIVNIMALAARIERQTKFYPPASDVSRRPLDRNEMLVPATQADKMVNIFTTKPGGSGIGLVLSRQIAEAHGGSLDLRNRVTGPGCEARLMLPV